MFTKINTLSKQKCEKKMPVTLTRKILPSAIILVLSTTFGDVSVAQAKDNTCVEYDKVRSESDQIKAAMSDAWLDGKLESALLFNTHLNSFNIDTEVKSCVAYLTGFVKSSIDKDLAGEIAESIDGIKDVKNKLVVDNKKQSAEEKSAASESGKGKFRQAVMDATLTARIKTELLMNTNTSGLSIDVDSSRNEVTLTGEVNSDAEKDLAEKIAKNTSDNVVVNNKLTVKE